MPATTDKLEKEASEWIEMVTGEPFDQSKTFQENIKDGTLLCKTFNNCFTDYKVKYTHSAMPFKQMENIATFLAALSKLPNFRSFDLFSTVDLYEGKNMAQVTRCILACKRFAEKENGNILTKGIENLNIQQKETAFKAESVTEPEKEFETTNEQPENEFERIEDVQMNFEEFESIEDNIEQQTTEEKTTEQIQQFSPIDETDFHDIISDNTQPEVILIDSPSMADDESEPIIKDEQIVAVEKEEFETFTQENPGTFEIQVTN